MRVLFVCLGNICRSPIGEGILRHLAHQGGHDAIEVDSAGTGAYHCGEPPDRRAQATARSQGIAIDQQRARQVRSEDFDRFDFILAMDRDNLRALRDLAPGDDGAILRLLRDYDPEGGSDVPDPYYGGAEGFDNVFRMVERCCRAFLTEHGVDPE